MRCASSNYLTPIDIRDVPSFKVKDFMASPPYMGFGFVYKDGYIDDEFVITIKNYADAIPLDCTHIVWFSSDEHARSFTAAFVKAEKKVYKKYVPNSVQQQNQKKGTVRTTGRK